jgi:hypothetical protein
VTFGGPMNERATNAARSPAPRAPAGRWQASPLNPQPIAIRGPFFQGWLIRTIDHARERSVMLIVASFSSHRSATYTEHYVFCAVTEHDTTRTFTAFPEAGSVAVSAPGESKGLDVRWTARGLGEFHFTDSLCVADFAFGDALSVSLRVENRRPWGDDGLSGSGPEGWLGNTNLLPSRYFIHSVGSDAAYRLRLDQRELVGRGFSHMECNHGNFFPRGWVWSEAIAPGNGSSFSLVIGKIVVGPLEPFISTFYLRCRDGRTAVFRTTDLDRVRYELDGVRKVAHLEFASRFTRKRAVLHIAAREPSFHKVFVPTAHGMSDAPGCEETYTAVATVVYEEGGAEEVYSFPLTAFEFGGSFIDAVHRNAAFESSPDGPSA